MSDNKPIEEQIIDKVEQIPTIPGSLLEAAHNLYPEAASNLSIHPSDIIFKAGELIKHEVGGYTAHRHKYVFNDMPVGTGIDPDVVAEQSRKQIKDDSELTIIVHHHRATEDCDLFTHDAYGTSLASSQGTQA
jgi:hypothetical protein